MTIISRATEAIADELRRQEPEHGGTYFIDAAHLNDTVVDGRFDLHAVARAVLEAIREPSEAITEEAFLRATADEIERSYIARGVIA